jgi:phosphoglycerol transferase
LTRIGLDNIDFSYPGELNGAYTLMGMEFTVGALVASTAGVGLNENSISNETLNSYWDEEESVDYLPKAYNLGDILEANGYRQVFLLGSDGNYAGRGAYFRNHGNYEIHDYNYAIENNRIPQDYKEWWGYEDEKLYEFAKEDLLALAQEEQPFNFTMLTADTHFPNGYKCELCENQYDTDGLNVFACADQQLDNFLSWIQEQGFYDNTTIVIMGDHISMDGAMISDAGVSPDYSRKSYVAIINPAEGNTEVPHEYCAMDIYPTTLAALGAEIKGNRLGLGTNLFSSDPTLVEEYGQWNLSEMLSMHSEYYDNYLCEAE